MKNYKIDNIQKLFRFIFFSRGGRLALPYVYMLNFISLVYTIVDNPNYKQAGIELGLNQAETVSLELPN